MTGRQQRPLLYLGPAQSGPQALTARTMPSLLPSGASAIGSGRFGGCWCSGPGYVWMAAFDGHMAAASREDT